MDTRFKRKYSVNDNFLDTIGPVQAWFVGLMASDGSIATKSTFSISQSHDKGKKLLEAVSSVLSFDGPIHYAKDVDSYSITPTSKPIVDTLSKFGVVKAKTLVYEFPGALATALYAPFLRGYIDGDGSVGVYNTGTTLCLAINFVGTPAFIERCAQIIPCSGHIRRIKTARNLSEYRAYGKEAIKLGQWLWADTSLPQHCKQQIFDEYIRTINTRYTRYAPVKAKVAELLDSGMQPMDISRQLGIGWKTIYRWKEKHANSKLIDN